MDKFDQLIQHVLTLSADRGEESMHFEVHRLAIDFSMRRSDVEDVFVGLHERGCVILSAYDGRDVVALDRWPDRETFFDNRRDGGVVRTKIKIPGFRLLDELNTRSTAESSNGEDMATFGTMREVLVNRRLEDGTTYRQRCTLGGDFNHRVLFNPGTDVKYGDTLDEGDLARVVVRISPVRASGELVYYEADLVTVPEFDTRTRSTYPPIQQFFGGPVGNSTVITGSSNSVVQTNQSGDTARLDNIIDRIDVLIQQASELDAEQKADLHIDAQQLKNEIRRPRFNLERVQSFLESITRIGSAAADLTTKLWEHRAAIERILAACLPKRGISTRASCFSVPDGP